MSRLRVCARVLTTVLVALIARAFIVGVSATIALAAGIVAALLIGTLLLLRQGHRLKPDTTRLDSQS